MSDPTEFVLREIMNEAIKGIDGNLRVLTGDPDVIGRPICGVSHYSGGTARALYFYLNGNVLTNLTNQMCFTVHLSDSYLIPKLHNRIKAWFASKDEYSMITIRPQSVSPGDAKQDSDGSRAI